MLLVKLTMLRKFDLSKCIALTVPVIFLFTEATAQDNSPYSRYGLGNLSPTTNVYSRGMGGIAAAGNDVYNVNYANPASYSFFESAREPNSRKLNYGRVVFNLGADAQARTLTDHSAQAKYTSPNILFSHVMIGAPIRKNWGLAMGIRPITSISYKVHAPIQKFDPITKKLIDTSVTVYEGQGGLYLGSLGTAVKFKTGKSQFLSIGATAGYLFGSRDYSSRLFLFNDTTTYASANFENKTGIGGLYFDAGLQYHIIAQDKYLISFGAYGNWQRKLTTKRSSVAETFNYSSSGNIPTDTVTHTSDVKGELVYPSSLTGGVLFQKFGGGTENEAGWQIGADFTYNNWNQYRFEGTAESTVKSNWQAKIGAEFRPAPKSNFLSRTAYRIGFYTGPDYIYFKQTKMPVVGITAGLGLPIANFSMMSSQGSMLNLSFEYIKRGNNKNVLQENLYRLSVGFSLTDIWFRGKTKYYED